MSWGEILNSLAVGASILGAILGLVTWALSTRTDRLIREMHADTQRTLGQLDARAAERHGDTLAVLDRLDARAEERHREARE